jgi:hypothetical protein
MSSRLPIALALSVALVAALSWLQGRFETTDVKRGIAVALRHAPKPGGPSIFEAITARGEGDPRCDGEVVSALFGDVRVRCAVPGHAGVRYDFRVLLDGKRPPRGESAAAQALLAALASDAAPSTDGGR